MPHSLDASAFLRISTRKPVRIRLRYERPNARHHPPASMIDDNSHAIAGRVHAVVMVPIDAISQPSPRPLAITHLASHVQEHQSLRSSITRGITRPASLAEHDIRRVGGRVHAVVRQRGGEPSLPLP